MRLRCSRVPEYITLKRDPKNVTTNSTFHPFQHYVRDQNNKTIKQKNRFNTIGIAGSKESKFGKVSKSRSSDFCYYIWLQSIFVYSDVVTIPDRLYTFPTPLIDPTVSIRQNALVAQTAENLHRSMCELQPILNGAVVVPNIPFLKNRQNEKRKKQEISKFVEKS